MPHLGGESRWGMLYKIRQSERSLTVAALKVSYKSLKLTSMVAVTGTGTPPRVPGLNCH